MKKDTNEARETRQDLGEQVGSRRKFLHQAIVAASSLALAPLFPRKKESQVRLDLFNPPELVCNDKGILTAVLQLSDAKRRVPNFGLRHLRLFQGWNLTQSSADARPAAGNVAPGPTLRARVGGKINLVFVNKVNEESFSYSLDTASAVDNACDASTSKTVYPVKDKWPNCFHGSSTANIHFHGTHTDPDGLGDNVLLQVVPDKNANPAEWAKMFAPIFDMSSPPSTWSEMPEDYQRYQLGYTAKELQEKKDLPRAGQVGKYDDEAEKKADRDKRDRPSSLWQWDAAQVRAGEWPQYVVGAYPNSLFLPKFTQGGPFSMGQAPGTHWYHAHKHGSTSLHIFNGLAGAIIIEGDYDEAIRSFFQKQLPSDHKFVERILVFQGIAAIQNLELEKRGSATPKLINGKTNPPIQMEPGEIQLWRFLNAMGGGNRGTIGSALFDSLKAQGFELKQMAFDGVQFAWRNYLDQPFLAGKVPGGLTLPAGNRADLLVKAPPTSKIARFSDNQGALFEIRVSGASRTMRFFEDNDADRKSFPPFPEFLEDLPPQDNIKETVSFEWDRGTGRGPDKAPPKFMLNGKQFGENKKEADRCMELGGVQDWLLTNSTSIPHPFHIHINPFQIVKIVDPKDPNSPYEPSKFRIWRDVINVPAGGSVRIRHKFADFYGTYVLHCHILAHEDRGMMELVRVVKKGNYPDGCALNHVAHH